MLQEAKGRSAARRADCQIRRKYKRTEKVMLGGRFAHKKDELIAKSLVTLFDLVFMDNLHPLNHLQRLVKCRKIF